MRPYQAILVLEDLRNSFEGPLHRKGVELSSRDRLTVLEVYSQWILLAVDLGYLSCDALIRDARRLFTTMVTVDVLELNNAFAELLHLVRCQEIKGFKALCHRVSPHLYHLVKMDIGRVMEGDVYAAKRLMQLFSYTSRLSLVDIDLTQQCLDDYLETEACITDQFPESLVQEMNGYVRSWMKSFDPTQIHFQHGPGGVAQFGRTSLETKYNNLASDMMLEYAFGEPWWVERPNTLARVSQTIFVAKSYKTFRTISMEPPTLQYCQQGIRLEVDRVVQSSRFLRRHIGLHEQERNQLLARKGSLSRDYATIDLSAASDSVSYALVKKVFRGTKLLRYLVATRSKETLLPDGRQIVLKKFAPMGSSLCFPVETIIFAALCQCVTRSRGVPGDYSVYGDDIIVPTQCAGDVIEALNLLGFRVNREKSFFRSDCWFRESCGSEFCNGFDVSPMRVSRKYASSLQLVEASSLVDLANTAYTKNFRFLRRFFIDKALKVKYVPLFAPTSLLSDNYTNYHTKKRWNRELQRIEVKATMLTTRVALKSDETIRYRHWLETTHRRSFSPGSFHVDPITHRISVYEGTQSRIGRSTVRAKERWVQKPYEDLDQAFIDLRTK